MANNADQQLIQQTLNGDSRAFAQLVEKYQEYVFTIVIRMLKVREEAEEVAQDIFIKVYESLSSFKGESKFSTWLYRIAYRKALDQIRKNKNRVQAFELMEELTEDKHVLASNPSEVMEEQERNQRIKQCIHQLGHTEAALITFFYFDELSIKEIASITELSEDNVKVKLHRSRKKLYDLMKRQAVLSENLRNHGQTI
ncbi:RNA polymerase sigma factor [Flagellimonas allohymeniacidonis]|uniref:RNA polymerase sigma factor n=1 Tax=Flagellimonas allohymeniacidonis TaxID=2517819 RepID=A0A4Q8QF66_9FLAO|nr:RNA polymerase sigma factor [Allomuricauda hymeniacidonis]TAI48317.1 RNA polymerase sigma factor [Allomuricauda hymeniacidonis]